MLINDLKPGRGSNRERKRLGRGTGSGLGTSAGRGTKGQNARKSGQVRLGFEGGQMPIVRRTPKRGFNHTQFALTFESVNIGVISERYNEGETVNRESLKSKRLISGNKDFIKILGDGELTKKLVFDVDKYSKSALEKIEKAGSSVKKPDEA